MNKASHDVTISRIETHQNTVSTQYHHDHRDLCKIKILKFKGFFFFYVCLTFCFEFPHSPLLHDCTRKQCQEQKQEANSRAHLIKKTETDSWKVQKQTDE